MKSMFIDKLNGNDGYLALKVVIYIHGRRKDE